MADTADLSLSNADPALRSWWHPVARAEDVGDAPLRTELLGVPWVVARLSGGLAAFVDRCPHRFAPMSAGRVVDGVLECAYHGWRFRGDGGCTTIPALGPGAHLPARACLAPAAVVAEKYGLVWIAPQQPRAGIVDLPEWGNPEFTLGWLTPRTTPMGAGYMMDNFIDFAHFPFLHAATIGAEAATIIDRYDVQRDGWSFSFSYTQPFSNYEDTAVADGTRPLVQTRKMETRYWAPFSLVVRYANLEQGAVTIIALFVQPVNARQSKLYNCVYRNDLQGDENALHAALEYEAKILDEDFALQELYDVHDLPLDTSRELHTRADRATVELRRILRDLVLAESPAGENTGSRAPATPAAAE
jgi:phenylpropionate dioxygenase-like ring-hydroxylating dioxygenase large terminal subunit